MNNEEQLRERETETNQLQLCALSRSEDSNKRPPGTPGTPGSRDLEAALRRLSLRRDNYLSEKRFFEDERERKLAYLAKEEQRGEEGSSGGPGTPTESLLSLCSHPSLGSAWSGYSMSARSYLPDKLQIVKPLEGDYSAQRRKSSLSAHNEKGSQSQSDLPSEHSKTSQQNQNHSVAQNANGEFLNTSQAPMSQTQSQSKALHNQQQNQYRILHHHSQSKLFLSASQDPETLQRSFSLLELSGQQSSQPHIRAPLALVPCLLGVVEQQEGSLNPQHSFYFRHTRPRCWFEV